MNNNTNLTIDLSLFQEYANDVLGYFAKYMEGGRFWNTHMEGYGDKCEAIALTARGEVVALHTNTRGCSINELKHFPKDQEHVDADGVKYGVYLCDYSCGGVFHTQSTIQQAIREYNNSLYQKGSMIVAYHEF